MTTNVPVPISTNSAILFRRCSSLKRTCNGHVMEDLLEDTDCLVILNIRAVAI